MMSRRVTVIDSTEASLLSKLGMTWQSRDLLVHMVKRDLNGRYRPASLGRAWIFLRPALEILTYVVVFGFFLGVRTTEMPYALFLCSGLVPWLFISQTIGGAADSLASARHVMSKVSFPRLIVPLANLCLALIDFLVLFAIVLLLVVAYRLSVGPAILALPLFIIMMVALAFGTSLLIATWSVSHPDVTIGVPVALRVMMYLSPIVYPPAVVPAALRPFFDLNPVAVIVSGIRWSIGGTAAPSAISVVFATVLVTVVLIAGLAAFVRAERRMIDFL